MAQLLKQFAEVSVARAGAINLKIVQQLAGKQIGVFAVQPAQRQVRHLFSFRQLPIAQREVAAGQQHSGSEFGESQQGVPEGEALLSLSKWCLAAWQQALQIIGDDERGV